MGESTASFATADYVVFTSSLCISFLIGMYQWFKSRGRDSKDFLMGGGHMSPIPVALSLLAGVVSAISILGNSSEMYYYGSQLWMNVWGVIIGAILTAFIIMPVIYPLRLISIYAGGAKAVVYTDTFQTLVMFSGIVVVIIQGCIEVGGGPSAWQIDKEYGRIEFFNLSTDPLERHTLMSTIILGIYFSLSTYGMSQTQFQRWASVATMQQSYLVMAINVVGLVALWSLIYYSGLVVFAVYAECDPLTAGYIEKIDQILVYFVVDKLGYLPGLPGLFVAAVYSGVLSSVSSCLNAISAMIWKDILQPLPVFNNASEPKAKTLTMIISLVSGGVGIILGILAGSMGGLFQASYTIAGALASPSTGLFLTAILCPWVTALSALLGSLTCLAFNMWLTVGALLYAPPAEMLPLSTDGCPTDNTTTTITTTATTTITPTETPDEIFQLYLLSYTLYGAIGILITIVMSTVFSCILGGEDPSEVPEDTVSKTCLRFYCWLRNTRLCRKLRSCSSSSNISSSSSSESRMSMKEHGISSCSRSSIIKNNEDTISMKEQGKSSSSNNILRSGINYINGGHVKEMYEESSLGHDNPLHVGDDR